jgi:DNA-binding SARP family transcriptional activator
MAFEPSTAPSLELRLLGTFQVTVDGVLVDDGRWARRKPQRLLELLALQPDHQLHREQIVDLLWPQLGYGSDTAPLYKTIHLARRALEPDLAPRAESRFLVTQGSLVILRAPGELWIDIDVFERQAAEAIRRKDVVLGETALALYGGELLPGELYEEWASARREQLRTLHQHLLSFLAKDHAAAHRRDRSVELLRQLLAYDPTNEDAHRSLMILFAQAGTRHQALQQYRECREALRRELDAEPGRDTQELYAAIASGQGFTQAEWGPAPPSTFDDPTSQSLTGIGSDEEKSPISGWGWRAMAALPALLPSRRAAILLCTLFVCAAIVLPAFRWSGRLRYRADRFVAKAETMLARWGGNEPRLISIVGRLDGPAARIEALDSISGWAAFTDKDGAFLLRDVRWYPGATYDLVASINSGAARRFFILAPKKFPEHGLLSLGTLAFNRGQTIAADGLLGVNSTSYLDFDRENLAYYQGVFDVLVDGAESDQEAVERINRYVASRYRAHGYALTSESPRRTLEQGSGLSGYLSLAMATVVRAGGYDVRIIYIGDSTNEGNGHTLVEVFYGGGWHVFDPAYGRSINDEDGSVASYEALRRNPQLATDAVFPAVQRVGWKTNEMPSLYTSGIHHYNQFKETTVPKPLRWSSHSHRSAPVIF